LIFIVRSVAVELMMRTMRARRLFVIAVLLFALAGCGGAVRSWPPPIPIPSAATPAGGVLKPVDFQTNVVTYTAALSGQEIFAFYDQILPGRQWIEAADRSEMRRYVVFEPGRDIDPQMATLDVRIVVADQKRTTFELHYSLQMGG
jgi:hypothetical protein